MGTAGSHPRKEPSSETYAAIARKCKFSDSEIRILFRKFAAVSGMKVADGTIDVDELQTAIGFKSREFAVRVFSAFDSDRSQDVEFSEFAWGAYCLSSRAKLADRARFYFDVYDVDRNNEISKEELATIISLASENAGAAVSRDQLEKVVGRTLERLDRDKSGSVSFEEFLAEAGKNPAILSSIEINLDELLSKG
jgi:Ca2+-binding EF-hand superfamily protein